MTIGVPKEIKNNENRVSMTPAGVHSLSRQGHRVLVEKSAGEGSGFSDADYVAAGAELCASGEEAYACDLVVKVKEPLESEYRFFRKGLTLFTYLHLAPNRPLTEALVNSGVTGIAFETVQLQNGLLPLLIPMSEVAGRMSVQVGAYMQHRVSGGEGLLLGGVPGVPPAEVVVISGGTAGLNAARMAHGLGARVTLLEVSQSRMAYIDEVSKGQISTVYSNPYSIAEAAKKADLLISGVLIPGAKAPKVVTESMVKAMKKGSVIVDIAIDQGGSVETIDRITTHDKPCYERHGVIHYSVANMPGAVPRTSTLALSGATQPYVEKLAGLGAEGAMKANPALLLGLNTYGGHVTYQAVAQAFGMEYADPTLLM